MNKSVFISSKLLSNENWEQLALWANKTPLTIVKNHDLSYDEQILLARLRAFSPEIKLIEQTPVYEMSSRSVLVVSNKEQAVGKQQFKNIYVVSNEDQIGISDRFSSVRSISQAENLWQTPQQHKNLLIQFEKSLKNNIVRLRRVECQQMIRQIVNKYSEKDGKECISVKKSGIIQFGRLLSIQLTAKSRLKARVFQSWRIHTLQSNIERNNEEIIEKSLIQEHKFKLKTRIFFTWKSMI